ncbi:MAG: hypothetical protein ABSG57_05065 [Candidatus Bathyarchaeia archaeon]
MTWKPNAETKQLLDFCVATIKSVPYKPNLRWLFYRALQSGLLKDKGEASVHKFDYALSRARKEFYDEWKPDSLEDSVRQGFWKGEFFAGYDVRLDNIEEQENYVQVWFEAYAMFQQFTHYTQPYRVSLVPFRGDCSIPLKWELAKKLEEINGSYHKPTKILYFGDYDLKGFQILEAALKDIKAWCNVPFTVERVGLTLEQVKEYGIPENPEHPDAYQWEALNDKQAGTLIINSIASLVKPVLPGLEEQEKLIKSKINTAMVTILQQEGVIE